MSKKYTLAVEPRLVSGKKVKTLRRQGLIPANIFGKKLKSFAIQVDAKAFANVFNEAGETSLIYLTLSDQKQHPVLIAALQKHPITGQVLHIDFRQVVLTEKVKAMIPLDLTGESLAVKDLNGVLVQAVSEIEVEALPTDFPDSFTLDITPLKEIGDSLLFKDLPYDHAKLTLTLNPEDTLVTIKAQVEEKVEEVPVPVEAEAAADTAEAAPETAKAESDEPKATAKPDTESKKE